jgi:hypothetical protein
MVELGGVLRSSRTEPTDLKEGIEQRDVPVPLGVSHGDDCGRASLAIVNAEILGRTNPPAAAAGAPSKMRLWLQAWCVSDEQLRMAFVPGSLREPTGWPPVAVCRRAIAVSHG